MKAKPASFTQGPYRSRILNLLESRGSQKTACPSEVLPPQLKKSQATMEKVRQVARQLAKEGKIEILRSGKKALPSERGPIRLKLKTKALKFDYSLDFKKIDFRQSPELYQVGVGEQGVLLVEPYKSEILPHWRFRTKDIAEVSAKKIYSLFLEYGRKQDLIGMDMARKFLQMGVTRSRRYANHRSGQKYVGAVPIALRGQSGAHGRKVAKLEPDFEKAKSAEVFREYLEKAIKNKKYQQWRAEMKANALPE